MNLLSKSEVFAENKLFATLDTTVRKVTIDNLYFLLSDTVGFIRKLPTQLVESFKSTLDEVREADILLHVVYISHFIEEVKRVADRVTVLRDGRVVGTSAVAEITAGRIVATLTGGVMGLAMIAAGPLYASLAGGAYAVMALPAVLSVIGGLLLSRAWGKGLIVPAARAGDQG